MGAVAVFEGDTDLPVLRKLVEEAGLEIAVPLDCSGKARIDLQLREFNAAAKGSPWIVLRDLDQDARCAPERLKALGFRPEKWMCLRFAVRELEAWLLADREGISEFLGVSLSLVSDNPDALVDPTKEIVKLASRSKRHGIRRDMVPFQGASAVVGPLYEARIIEFGAGAWDLNRACSRSESLCGARDAIRTLGNSWRKYTVGRH